jgi:hypothetical protein
MNTMDALVWMFPVLFMIHEFEEIFMIEAWWTRNKEKIKATWPKVMPFGLNYAGPYLSASIAIAIFTEFILIIVVCLVCAIFKNYYAWYGFLVGVVLHMFLLHLRDVIKFKGYTPGIITCALLVIPAIWMLYQANTMLHYGVLEIVLSWFGMQFVGWLVLFRYLHKATVSFSKWLSKYAKAESGEYSPGEAASES